MAMVNSNVVYIKDSASGTVRVFVDDDEPAFVHFLTRIRIEVLLDDSVDIKSIRNVNQAEVESEQTLDCRNVSSCDHWTDHQDTIKDEKPLKEGLHVSNTNGRNEKADNEPENEFFEGLEESDFEVSFNESLDEEPLVEESNSKHIEKRPSENNGRHGKSSNQTVPLAEDNQKYLKRKSSLSRSYKHRDRKLKTPVKIIKAEIKNKPVSIFKSEIQNKPAKDVKAEAETKVKKKLKGSSLIPPDLFEKIQRITATVSPKNTDSLPPKNTDSLPPKNTDSLPPKNTSSVPQKVKDNRKKTEFLKIKPVQPVTCEYCSETFKNKQALFNHRRYPSSGIYICSKNMCGHRFQYKAFLYAHNQLYHQDQESRKDIAHISCHICGFKTKRENTLKEHYMTHTEEYFYKCCVCDKHFVKGSSLNNHMTTHANGGMLKCTCCNQLFATRGALSRHKLDVSVVWCRLCGISFPNKTSRTQHFKNFHAHDILKCTKCTHMFSSAEELAVHMKRHTLYKKKQCPTCGKFFSRLEKHVLTHRDKADIDESELFVCDKCPQKFTNRSSFQRHTNMHSMDRPYQCPNCPRTFSDCAPLRKHLRRHSSLMPYECEICGKKCKEAGNLKVHMRIHSTTKHFPCPLCPQAFNYKSSLQGHLRSRHQQVSAEGPSGSEAEVKRDLSPERDEAETRRSVDTIATEYVPRGSAGESIGHQRAVSPYVPYGHASMASYEMGARIEADFSQAYDRTVDGSRQIKLDYSEGYDMTTNTMAILHQDTDASSKQQCEVASSYTMLPRSIHEGQPMHVARSNLQSPSKHLYSGQQFAIGTSLTSPEIETVSEEVGISNPQSMNMNIGNLQTTYAHDMSQ